MGQYNLHIIGLASPRAYFATCTKCIFTRLDQIGAIVVGVATIVSDLLQFSLHCIIVVGNHLKGTQLNFAKRPEQNRFQGNYSFRLLIVHCTKLRFGG